MYIAADMLKRVRGFLVGEACARAYTWLELTKSVERLRKSAVYWILFVQGLFSVENLRVICILHFMYKVLFYKSEPVREKVS